ncbi:hypothetical protein [Fischerella thermalis]|uniref:hypothetical protein n=1 Tax=Fischerella thermalis TaxID=372787 RepID=UPI0015E1087F|nr:hypothetical protein [Fischerella thermalis]
MTNSDRPSVCIGVHLCTLREAASRLRFSKIYLSSYRLELNRATIHSDSDRCASVSSFLRSWRGGRDNYYRTPMNTDEHRCFWRWLSVVYRCVSPCTMFDFLSTDWNY